MNNLSELLSNVAFLGVMLVALVIVGYVLIRTVRARVRSGDATELFTLTDLRALRASGQLSDAEYERMRALLVGTRPASDGARPAVRDSDDS